MSYKHRAPEPDAPDTIETQYPCSECKRPTDGKQMGTFGARCMSCFRDYVRRNHGDIPQTTVKQRDSLSPAAYCLLRIAMTGRMTEAQKHLAKSCARVVGERDREILASLGQSAILEVA